MSNTPSTPFVVLISLISGFVGGIAAAILLPMILAGAVLGGAVAHQVSKDTAVAGDVQKAKTTMEAMRTIATALEQFEVDHQRYPHLDDLATLAIKVEPTYIKEVPWEDGWGRRFEVHADGLHYEIRSLGRDGVRDTDPPIGRFSNLDHDIIFSDGRFTQWPEGSVQ